MHKLVQRLLVVVAVSTALASAGKGGGTVILPKPGETRPALAGVIGD